MRRRTYQVIVQVINLRISSWFATADFKLTFGHLTEGYHNLVDLARRFRNVSGKGTAGSSCISFARFRWNARGQIEVLPRDDEQTTVRDSGATNYKGRKAFAPASFNSHPPYEPSPSSSP